MFVSIDPGLRKAGIAWWTAGKLTKVSYSWADVGEGPDQILASASAIVGEFPPCVMLEGLVVEKMEFRSTRTDAVGDILDVQSVVGALMAKVDPRLVKIEFALPSVWTGKRKKEVNHPRILSRLDEAERAAVEHALASSPAMVAGEILDAVGIGLYHLRRL